VVHAESAAFNSLELFHTVLIGVLPTRRIQLEICSPMDDLPNFERFPDHEFQIGEPIYVLDPNEFDIWTAEVTEVLEDELGVHYPDWPEDDGPVPRIRCLVVSDKNRVIFEDQERTRAEKERQLSSGGEFESSSDSDEETARKRKMKKKGKKPPKEKKPPKAKKPPKEKKVRPPREPKPHKEKKERVKKERKPKQEKKKDVSQGKRENLILNRARMDQVRTIEDFEDFLDRHYGDDQEVLLMRDELIRRYQRYASQRHDGDSSEDLFDSSGSEEVESSSSEIEERYYEPEYMRLPPTEDVIDGFGIRMPSYLSVGLSSASSNKEGILFDEDGNANCFIYEVSENEKWLILNGHKFRIKALGDSAHPEFYCCRDVEVVDGNHLTGSIFYPRVGVTHDISLIHPTEDGEYWNCASAEKKQKKGQVNQLDEIPVPIPKVEKPKGGTKRRVLTENALEDSSDSD
jgi:hypothetical protein